MITVGLVNELYFISQSLASPVTASVKSNWANEEIKISIKDGVMDLLYGGWFIWKEKLGDSSMFGVESCSTIREITELIDDHDDRWRALRYIEDDSA